MTLIESNQAGISQCQKRPHWANRKAPTLGKLLPFYVEGKKAPTYILPAWSSGLWGVMISLEKEI
jgi:hypothetical protein